MRLRALLDHPALLAGSLIVLVFLGIAILAPTIAPPEDVHAPQYIPRYGNSPNPQPPEPGHPLGRLSFQYDVFYGLIWGTRFALTMGLIVTLCRLLLGVAVGLLAGASGGLLDALLMRIADAVMAFPMIAAAVVMLALFGYEGEMWPSGWYNLVPSRQDQIVMLTLVMFGWVPYARLMRGNVLVEREKTYIKAARSVGVPTWRLVLRHLFPNSTYGLIALGSSDIGAVVVLITAFTFIGLEPDQTMHAEWGRMLSTSRDWIIGAPSTAFKYWYTYVPVSAAIVLFSTGWSLVGDGLRDALDPRLRSLKVAPAKRRASSKQPIPAVSAANAHALEEAALARTVRRRGFPLDDPRPEYLAARQSATEALLLPPDERRLAPDWVHTTGVFNPAPSPALPLGGQDTVLGEARLALGQGDIPQALAKYRELIRSKQHLAQVLQDLDQMIQRFPQDPAVLEALGDSHLRLGHTQQALEVYSRAERLLRRT